MIYDMKGPKQKAVKLRNSLTYDLLPETSKKLFKFD